MPRRPARALALGVSGFALLVIAGSFAVACGGGGGSTASPQTGRQIFAARCATCHGVDGQGGVGPQLAGVVADKYPDIEDQIAVVTNGRNQMPSFRGTLDSAEIRRVVAYERTKLGG